MKKTPSFSAGFKRGSFGKTPMKMRSFLPPRWTSSASTVSSSMKFPTTLNQNAIVCTTWPTGTERIIFGLRTNEGILRSKIVDHEAELDDLEKAGYLEARGDRVRLTRAGRLVADEIGALFV